MIDFAGRVPSGTGILHRVYGSATTVILIILEKALDLTTIGERTRKANEQVNANTWHVARDEGLISAKC